jgi:hypothetical protein
MMSSSGRYAATSSSCADVGRVQKTGCWRVVVLERLPVVVLERLSGILHQDIVGISHGGGFIGGGFIGGDLDALATTKVPSFSRWPLAR